MKMNINIKMKMNIIYKYYLKMTVTIIPTNLVTNSLLSLFCPFMETKNKNQILSKVVVW